MGLVIIKGEDTVSKELMLMLHHGNDTIFLRRDDIIRLKGIIGTIDFKKVR